MAGVAVVNAVIFGVYGQAQKYIPDPATLTSYFLAGSLAGIAQTPICSPMELAKTRMQLRSTSSVRFTGPFQCLKYTYTHEGLRGVFRGTDVTFLREVPSFGVYFLTYEALTRTADNSPVSTPSMLLAGGLAGTTSWMVSYPLDVIKSRIQAHGSRYNGITDCLRQSMRAEGYSWLYRGLSSTILRAFPTNAVTFTVVTWTFRLLGGEEVASQQKEKPKSSEFMGEISGLREPLFEKWNNFLANASMVVHRLPYSTLSVMSTNELQLEGSVQSLSSDRWSKDGTKEGTKDATKRGANVEQVIGNRNCKEEEERSRGSMKEEVGEKKEERNVAKQAVKAVAMALA